MSDTTIRAAEPVVDAEQLNPIQRAYLVGERPGMELNGPARYYLPCALDPKRVPGMAGRLREMVRDNAVLRLDPSADLFVTTLPERDAQDVDVPRIIAILGPMFRRYAREREQGERFGDFVIRTGYVEPTLAGNTFHAEVRLAG